MSGSKSLVVVVGLMTIVLHDSSIAEAQSLPNGVTHTLCAQPLTARQITMLFKEYMASGVIDPWQGQVIKTGNLALATTSGQRDGLPAVVKSLSDEDIDVRWVALLVFNEHRKVPIAALRPLIRLLEDQDRVVRELTYKSLVSLGPRGAPAVDGLEKALARRDISLQERIDVMRTLSAVAPKDPRVTKRLIEYLVDPGSAHRTRVAATIFLGRRGSAAKAALPHLLKLSKEPGNPFAAEALFRIAPQDDRVANVFVKLTDSPQFSFTLLIVLEMGPSAARYVPHLVRLLKDKDEEKQAYAVGALHHVDKNHRLIQPTLVRLLKDGSADGKGWASWIAANQKIVITDKTAVPALIEMLKTHGKYNGAKVLETLGLMGASAEAAIPTLRSLVLRRPSPYTVRDAANALRAIDTQRVASAEIDRYLSDRSHYSNSPMPKLLAVAEHYRKTDVVIKSLTEMLDTNIEGATEGLVLLGARSKPAVPALTKLLNNASPDVRQRAVYILGKIGPSAAAALPALERLRNDKHLFVRWHVEDALKSIK